MEGRIRPPGLVFATCALDQILNTPLGDSLERKGQWTRSSGTRMLKGLGTASPGTAPSQPPGAPLSASGTLSQQALKPPRRWEVGMCHSPRL